MVLGWTASLNVAVNADEDDADLARFVGFLAREVNPMLS